jgi:hypothetical protein
MPLTVIYIITPAEQAPRQSVVPKKLSGGW